MKKYFWMLSIDKNGNMPASRLTLNQRRGASRNSIEINGEKIKLKTSPFDSGKELSFDEIIQTQTGSYPAEINLIDISYISFKFKEGEKEISYTFVDKKKKVEETIALLKDKLEITTIDNPEVLVKYNKMFWKIVIIAFVIIILFLIYEIFIFIPSLTG